MLLEQLFGALGSLRGNTTNLEFHAQVAELGKCSNVLIVNGDGAGNLTLAFGHMHIADVDLLDGNATLDKTQNVSGGLADDEDLLLVTCLVDRSAGLLDGPVTHRSIAGSSHIHQALTHLVASDFVVGDKDQVCTDGAAPLGCDLAMDKTIVDTSDNDVRHDNTDKKSYN